jgi:hypothetical protein
MRTVRIALRAPLVAIAVVQADRNDTRLGAALLICRKREHEPPALFGQHHVEA